MGSRKVLPQLLLFSKTVTEMGEGNSGWLITGILLSVPSITESLEVKDFTDTTLWIAAAECADSVCGEEMNKMLQQKKRGRRCIGSGRSIISALKKWKKKNKKEPHLLSHIQAFIHSYTQSVQQ